MGIQLRRKALGLIVSLKNTRNGYRLRSVVMS